MINVIDYIDNRILEIEEEFNVVEMPIRTSELLMLKQAIIEDELGKSIENKVDMSKSLYEQKLPCCLNCKFVDSGNHLCGLKCHPLTDMDNTLCADYQYEIDYKLRYENPYQE